MSSLTTGPDTTRRAVSEKRPGPTGSPDGPRPRVGAAWPIVATREVVARLTDKNFLISTGFTLVLLIGVFAFQAFMASKTSTTHIAVTSPTATQIVASTGSSGIPGLSSSEIAAVQVPDEAAARAALEDGSADAWLHQKADSWVLTGKDEPSGQLQATVGSAVNAHVLAANAAKAGTSMETLSAGSRLTVDSLVGAGDSQGDMIAQIAGFVFAMLFYFASLMFGMAIATSVVEEKQSRIIEILATAIPIRQLLIGKVLGNSALALGQMVLFVGVALVGVSFTDYGSFLPSLAGPSAWFLVFFLVGFIALACIWAVCGSLASRSEDLQSTTMPMSLLLVGLLFLGMWASGTTKVIASYVPIASVVTMPSRLLDGSAAWWEPIGSLALTIACAGGLILLAERIYRRSLLQTGGRLTLRQALKVQE